MKKTRELRPLRERPEYYEHIEKYLRDYLRKQIYEPLVLIMRRKPSQVIQNAKYDALGDAILSGKIQRVDTHFEGKFSSQVSKELKALGAKWDRSNGWWSIPTSSLPLSSRGAIGTASVRADEMGSRLKEFLGRANPKDIAAGVNLDDMYMQTMGKFNKDFEASMKSVAVQVKFTPDQMQRVAKEYTQNMQLYIQEFTEKEITDLRQKVMINLGNGFRYEGMVKDIQDSYGVSERKAKFLARQETSLLTTKIKQVRYQDAGVNKYKWRCVTGTPQHPVRPMHKELDGTNHTWDNPPTVDKNGSRKHPGQDYGCRCVAIPIVEL